MVVGIRVHAHRERDLARGLRVFVAPQAATLSDRQDQGPKLCDVAALIESREARRGRKRNAEVAPQVLPVALKRLQRIAVHGTGQDRGPVTPQHDVLRRQRPVRDRRHALVHRRERGDDRRGQLEQLFAGQRDRLELQTGQQLRQLHAVGSGAEHGQGIALPRNPDHAAKRVVVDAGEMGRARANGLLRGRARQCRGQVEPLNAPKMRIDRRSSGHRTRPVSLTESDRCPAGPSLLSRATVRPAAQLEKE